MRQVMPEGWTLPALDRRNEAFFTEGRLLVQRCAGCGTVQHPPEDVCHRCMGEAFELRECAGTGTVYSYTVAHRAPHPVFVEQLPLIVAIVELEEGPRLVTNLVGCEPGELEVGMAVEAIFEPIDDTDVVLPVFTPRRGPG